MGAWVVRRKGGRTLWAVPDSSSASSPSCRKRRSQRRRWALLDLEGEGDTAMVSQESRTGILLFLGKGCHKREEGEPLERVKKSSGAHGPCVCSLHFFFRGHVYSSSPFSFFLPFFRALLSLSFFLLHSFSSLSFSPSFLPHSFHFLLLFRGG